MILILVPGDTPRLRYALDLVLGRVLGLRWQAVTRRGEIPAGVPWIDYAGASPEAVLAVPNAGLLAGQGCAPVDPGPRRRPDGTLELFAAPPGGGSPPAKGGPGGEASISGTRIWPFDLFSAAFYLAAEYARYTNPPIGPHGRYDQSDDAAWGLDRTPWIAHWAQELHAALALPGALPPPPPDELTVDVDFPWKYRFKPLHIQAGALARDLLRLDLREARTRLAVWAGAPDPYSTWSRLEALMPPQQIRLFFLIGRHSPHDSRFSARTPAYRRLIARLAAAGYQIGIHPSYTTPEHPGRLLAEVRQLRALIGQPLDASRQHFLRYRLPGTRRALLEAGIRQDYTPCLFASGGFPAGMCSPWPWYDLEAEAQTSLMLHPTILMDRSARQYLRLTPEQTLAHAQHLLARTRSYGGAFTLLIHNDTLSGTDDWRGWQETWETIIGQMTR
ncbi:MAG: polysaccharide deacetylase family protein [Bacteroidia bacterium]|nr:polysaccharide deacetylase family protein [Bacteroidia bacterium]